MCFQLNLCTGMYNDFRTSDECCASWYKTHYRAGRQGSSQIISLWVKGERRVIGRVNRDRDQTDECQIKNTEAVFFSWTDQRVAQLPWNDATPLCMCVYICVCICITCRLCGWSLKPHKNRRDQRRRGPLYSIWLDSRLKKYRYTISSCCRYSRHHRGKCKLPL